MGERRTEQRRNLFVKVEVRWEDEAGTSFQADAKIEDESGSGVCLRLDRPVAVGRKLAIHSKDSRRVGVVRHCGRTHGAFILGIEWE
jgi:hypothetical protein